MKIGEKFGAWWLVLVGLAMLITIVVKELLGK